MLAKCGTHGNLIYDRMQRMMHSIQPGGRRMRLKLHQLLGACCPSAAVTRRNPKLPRFHERKNTLQRSRIYANIMPIACFAVCMRCSSRVDPTSPPLVGTLVGVMQTACRRRALWTPTTL
jgi:hypothetical protein